MQLGKALVGAIIGGALGILVLLVVFLLFQKDQAWLAIVVAVFTGMGVRMMVAKGYPSYTRGALTALLALTIYLVGWLVVGRVASRIVLAIPPIAGTAAPSGEKTETDDEGKAEEDADATEPAATPQPAPSAGPLPDAKRGAPKRRDFSLIDLASLFIAASVAYALGRGSAGPLPGTEDEDESAPRESTPAGTHPDA